MQVVGTPVARKYVVGFALDVEMRHLVMAHQRRHAGVVELHPAARVLERGPDHVLHARLARSIGHGMRLGALLVRRKVIPEERHAVGAVGPGKRTRDGGTVD